MHNEVMQARLYEYGTGIFVQTFSEHSIVQMQHFFLFIQSHLEYPCYFHILYYLVIRELDWLRILSEVHTIRRQYLTFENQRSF